MEQISIERLKLLHPKIMESALDAYADAIEATPKNIHPFITQTLRTFEESDHLYALGRTVVNPDGVSPIKPFGNIVTKAAAGQSYHNYGLACFDEKTEILTEKGFIKFSELIEGERVATFKNDVCRFDTPIAYVSYPYNGEMVHIKTRSVDQLVTPNHKMIVQKKIKDNRVWETEWHKVEASKINYQYRIPTNAKIWEYIPQKKLVNKLFSDRALSSYQDSSLIEMQDYPFSNLMSADTWWEFMGWYLSEGYCAGSLDGILKKHNARFKVAICQSKSSSVYDKLKNCIERTGFNFSIGEREMVIHSKELWNVLHPLGNCYQKYIEPYLLNAPKELLLRLYYALIDGDGCYYSGHTSYYTASKKLADSFCELSLRVGFSVAVRERFQAEGSAIMPHGGLLQSNIFNFEIVSRNRITQELRNGEGDLINPKISKVNYLGMVYCVNTNDGAVVIRRNGKVSISGNCDFCILDDGKAEYIVDENWMIVVNCFKKRGFFWGGEFPGNFQDDPHLENRLNYNWRDLLEKYNAKDFIAGTTYLNI